MRILPCETDGRYFDAHGRTSSRPADLAEPDAPVSDEALFSLLQFGAIVPPLAPWSGVQRMMPGYEYHGTQPVGPLTPPPAHNISRAGPEQQADAVVEVLDRILLNQLGERDDPVVLFSGGVDSGIVAARLRHLGYRHSVLVNYCFGDDDRESRLAEAMAAELGLQFVRILPARHTCACLAEPGLVYAHPFGDRSVIPTSDLALAVADRFAGEKRIVIDGTGADGAFGMCDKIRKWQRVERVPAMARKWASLGYGAALWRMEGRAERVARICRRSTGMPLLSALLAINPLAGLLYRDETGHSVHSLLERWIGGWAGASFARQAVAGDLALICANTFAQKPKPILESAGHSVVYPFLDVEMVATALAAAERWQMHEPKAPLKRALARHVPGNMVYRPKSGFDGPGNDVFHAPEYIECLNAAAEPSGPIAHVIDKKRLNMACQLLSRGKSLPGQTLGLLWTIAFADRWYRTAKR